MCVARGSPLGSPASSSPSSCSPGPGGWPPPRPSSSPWARSPACGTRPTGCSSGFWSRRGWARSASGSPRRRRASRSSSVSSSRRPARWGTCSPLRWSGRSPPAWRWWRPCSTRPPASASAARCTCSSGGRPRRAPPPPDPASPKEGIPMSRNDVLVTADWAQEHLGDPGIVFVEVDEDTSAYDKGHIEGAVKLDWKTDLQDPLRRDFVSKEQFEELLSAKGISNDDTVVLYGGNNNWFAAYAYWYFTLYGHSDVKLIDGGRKKWELDSRPLSDATVQRPATQYKASEPDTSIRAFRDEVIDAIGSKNLVDVRSPDEFAGKLVAPAHLPQEGAQRPGHIPTAVNVPWSKAANEDGTFKSDDELRQLYADAGLDTSKDTIAYCRIGERSSHTWFVLRELLGEPNVKNYDGSWTEYGSLVGVPIEKGA